MPRAGVLYAVFDARGRLVARYSTQSAAMDHAEKLGGQWIVAKS